MSAERRLTGRHVLIIALSAFAVVFGANMALLWAATGSFPGLVVRNSYVASQGWEARSDAQRALGWQATAGYGEGEIAVRLTGPEGEAVPGLAVEATVGRPASDADDRTLTLAWQGDVYAAPVRLAPGRWQVAIRAGDGDATLYRATADLVVREAR